MAKIKGYSPQNGEDVAWQPYEPRRSEEFEPLTADETCVKVKGRSQGQTKTVGVLQLFRFSDRLDKTLMFLGTVCATVHGASLPFWMVTFGNMIQSFVGVGSLVTYLEGINDFLASSNSSVVDVLASPGSLNCSAIQEFYGGNVSCFEDKFQERLSEMMVGYAIDFCAIGVGVIFAAYGQLAFWMIAAERQAHRIRRACLGNVLRQDIGWFDTHDAGELNTRLGDDVNKIQEGIGDKFGIFWQWVSRAIVSIVIGFVYGWKLSLVILAASPIMVITAFLLSKVATVISKNELTAYAQAGAIAEEVLGAIRTVVAFGGEEKEAQRYKKNLSAAQAFGIKKGLANGLSMGLLWFTIFSMFGLGYWYGGKLFREDEGYDSSNVIIVMFSILIAAFSLGSAAPSLEVVACAQGAAHTIFQLIDCESAIDSSSEEGLKPSSVKGTIKFTDVFFNYPSRPDVKILDGLSLDVKQGQTVALVGSSGCGKSTLVQLLLRFYDPRKGKILIDDQDIRELNTRWLRNSIGLVSQEPILFATSIAENIRFGQDGVTIDEIVKASKHANAYDFIMNLPEKFETLVGERGALLSGGQKQRLAIARALVRNPRILLLDEATSALDTESESIVQDALDKAREGRTTLIIAHRLSTIRTADIIIGIDGGQVAEMGSHDELMEKGGIYHQLVMNQQTGSSKEDQEIEDELQGDTVRKMSSAKARMSITCDLEKEEEDDLPDAPFVRIMKLNASEWPFILAGCLGSIANGAVWPSYAIVFSRILKIFSYPDEKQQEEELQIFSLMFIGIGLLSLLTYFLQSYMFGYSGETLTTRLRDLCFRSILRQEISWFDEHRNNVGALTTRLATDASLVQGVTGHRIGGAIMGLSNMTMALIIAFMHGWKMSLILIGFLPILVLGGVMQIRVLAGITGKNKEALEIAGKVTVESIGNIRTVAALSKEPTFLCKYMESLEGPYRAALKNCHMVGLTFGISQGVIFFAYAVAFAFGAFMIEEGEMDIEDVFIVYSAIIFGSVGLGHASAFAPDLGKAKASAKRIMHIIDSEPFIDYTSSNGEKLYSNYKADVAFKDVNFSYPNRKAIRVLQELTFSVSPGQTVALVGSSGCGKSTSLQLLERFYDCSSGQVVLDGHDIRSLNLKWLREQVGIVSQEPVLFDTSIAENIAYGDNTRIVNMNEIVSAARLANIHTFITSLPDGYDTNVGTKGTQLSGGQKQRIAIARALVRNPKILLLDEATSALDTESEKIVQEALDRAREGRTCVVIAHRLSTVQTADNIYVVSHGHVVENGTHSELMAKQGRYFELVRRSGRE